MVKKSADPTYVEGFRGRRPGDPAAKRAYRYVMRMHPDLANALNQLADEAGLSRSLFVERVLISFVNQDPRIDLDHIGRKKRGDTLAPTPPGSLASFGQRWSRWQALRHDVIGEEHPDPYGGASIDDHGRDAQGHPTTSGPRPPMPDHLRKHQSSDKIRPHRGSSRGGTDKK
jgi:hypothetical protein